MTVTITDNRTTIDECDATTDWGDVGESMTVYTTGPSPAELSGCLGMGVSEQNSYGVHTLAASVNLSAGYLVSWWMYVAGTAEDASNYGMQLVFTDGTNTIGYVVGGQDQAGFRHDSGPAAWQCFTIDTGSLPATFYAHAGSEASLDWTAITRMGVGANVTSKALGGGDNVYVDIGRWDNDGVTLHGGGTSARGTFEQAAAVDRSEANGTAHGAIRTLTTGVFGIRQPITIAPTSAAAYWDDTGSTVVFESFGISDGILFFNVAGTASYSQYIWLTDCIIKSAAHTVSCDFTDQYIVTLDFDNVQFIDLKAAVNFTNTAAATGHTVDGCTFSNCGQIDPGDVTFSNNTISASAASATGAVLLDADGTSNWSNLSFVSGGTGHAIYITAAGSYTFSGFTYSGYGADDTTNACVYNNSGGAVSITVSGGDGPTVRNGTSASTTVTNTKSITITVVDGAGSVVQDVQVIVYKTSGSGSPASPYTSASGNNQGDTNFVVTESLGGDTPVGGWIRVVADESSSDEQLYRYASLTAASKQFNLPTKVGPYACSGGGTSTLLQDTTRNFTTLDIEVGDTIRNETDGSWATVLDIIDASNITTTPLKGGTDNTWTSGDNWSVHSLAKNYGTSEEVFVPLLNEPTNASGVATMSTYNYQTPVSVKIAARKAGYKPTVATGSISGNFSTTVTIQTEPNYNL